MVKNKTIKEKIVEAARERFLHYGYGKTTMAEVATDCNMSPGNLYRYFPGKLDIAEEIVRRDKSVQEERLLACVNQPSCGALNKLRSFLTEILEYTFLQMEHDPRLSELVWTIIHERPEVSEEVTAMERRLMAKIIAAGNAAGEFAVDDVNFTAEMICAATTRFRYPQIRSVAPLERLKRELNGVIDLLAYGLGRHAPYGPSEPARESRAHV